MAFMVTGIYAWKSSLSGRICHQSILPVVGCQYRPSKENSLPLRIFVYRRTSIELVDFSTRVKGILTKWSVEKMRKLYTILTLNRDTKAILKFFLIRKIWRYIIQPLTIYKLMQLLLTTRRSKCLNHKTVPGHTTRQ